MSNPFERAPGEKHGEQGHSPCPVCGGGGKVQESGKQVTCKRCNGTGEIPTS